MVKSRRAIAEMAKPEQPTLFETRSEELVPDLNRLPAIIADIAESPATRGDVINAVIKQELCQFHRTEIRECIERMLKLNQLKSEPARQGSTMIPKFGLHEPTKAKPAVLK